MEMSYIVISQAIETWATANKITVLQEDREPNRRYFYVSSPSGETFQFIIEPEHDGVVRMDAHLIESPSDEEAHFVWKVPTSQTYQGLELGIASAQAWFKRAPAGIAI
jgi:hypothetical protein